MKSTLTGLEVDRIVSLHARQTQEERFFPHHPTINQRMDINRRDAYIRLGRESAQSVIETNLWA